MRRDAVLCCAVLLVVGPTAPSCLGAKWRINELIASACQDAGGDLGLPTLAVGEHLGLVGLDNLDVQLVGAGAAECCSNRERGAAGAETWQGRSEKSHCCTEVLVRGLGAAVAV